ncbi:MAG TPA: SDR family oxidoreductase [Gemmatimonadaceae bacterium]|jgi:NAD(P)-dependent dehydrogenase (short-subunit alcohol dehydrogenase family)
MTQDSPIAVVTGIGRTGQTGEVIARVLAETGMRIVAIARSGDEAKARADDLRAAGHDAQSFACDLSDESQVANLARDIAKIAGAPPRIAALVNIAGGFGMSGPVADSTFDVWHTQVSINLITAYLATRAFLPMLRAARGAIVYFSSAAALPGANVSRMWAYAASKSGVIALMRAVAEEERTSGVRANALAPTAIRTEANQSSMGDKTKYVEREDVAAAVSWLCSDASRAVTGQVIRLG